MYRRAVFQRQAHDRFKDSLLAAAHFKMSKLIGADIADYVIVDYVSADHISNVPVVTAGEPRQPSAIDAVVCRYPNEPRLFRFHRIEGDILLKQPKEDLLSGVLRLGKVFR